jgi:hypothetical protein
LCQHPNIHAVNVLRKHLVTEKFNHFDELIVNMRATALDATLIWRLSMVYSLDGD